MQGLFQVFSIARLGDRALLDPRGWRAGTVTNLINALVFTLQVRLNREVVRFLPPILANHEDINL
jgi:hypothetical protein